MENNEDNKAKITYKLIDDKTIKIDIEILEFDQESIESLATICAKLSSEQIAYETVKNIRDLLLSNDQMALLVPFVSKLNEQTKLITKLFNTKEQNENKMQPCIRPSDMM